MKLRHYILILIAGFLISCSKDDPKPEMGWFPVKITKTDYFAESGNRTIHLEYNNKNQISRIEIIRFKVGSSLAFIDEYTIEYNSTNIVETMQFKSSDPVYGGITTYTFAYEDELIVSWATKTVAPNGDNLGIGTELVHYNHPRYNVDGWSIDNDINNDISRMHCYYRNNSGTYFVTAIIHKLSNGGVFENVKPLVPLQLLFTIYFEMEMDFYAFSRHEISHLELPSQTVNFQTFRNLDDQISSVISANGSTMYARYDYEYEERKMQ
jgi:hypothetical protein